MPRLWLNSLVTGLDDSQRLRAIVERMNRARIVVLGGPVLDCYLYGSTHRISREAPVLIVREEHRELRLGGAANTAANAVSLGAQTTLVGLIGADSDGAGLRSLCDTYGIASGSLVERAKGCTVTKTRVMAGGLHTTKQQMLRIDRENDVQASAEDRERIEAAISTLDYDALIVSDYGDASLTDLYVTLAQRAYLSGKRVVVDSRYATERYSGVTAMTPNQPEAEQALGRPLNSIEDAKAAALQLTKKCALEAAVLTRGRQGMILATADGAAHSIPAFGAHEAVDVTGAGDTVSAVFTLALATAASFEDAARLANVAASLVVQQVGAATCTQQSLIEAIEKGPRTPLENAEAPVAGGPSA